MPIKKARKLLLYYPPTALVSLHLNKSNSSTPVEVYNKYIYNMDVETGRLLSAGVKFTRFTEQIIKTLSPIQNKHILFLKIRYKYNYIFR